MVRRFFFFGAGVFLGILLVYVLLIKNNPRDIMGWLPGKRVLQMLREDTLIIPHRIKCQLECLGASDTLANYLLTKGDVNLGESSPRSIPKRYIIRNPRTQAKFEFLSYKDSTVFSKIFFVPENCQCP